MLPYKEYQWAGKTQEQERLQVEAVEDEYYITPNHPMTREHDISFVALLTDDTSVIKRQYPQWDLSLRLPRMGRGKLLYFCQKHGLFVQNL